MSHAAHPRRCRADQCMQGRGPCPCPQACELPDAPLSTAQRIATSLLAHALFVAASAAAVALLVVFGPSA